MARFRAYTSDSSDEDEGEQVIDEKASESISEEEQEEDESDEESLSSGSSSSQMQEDELVGSRNALVADDDGEYHYAHELTQPSTSKSYPPSSRDPNIIPRAHAVGVDAQRMHVMQTSLFRMPEEAAALKAMTQATNALLRVQNQSLNRKHSRDSEGDGLRFDARERASFAHDIEPPSHRPSRKYARVESSASLVSGTEDAVIDAGLASGRSFRVGWGPAGQLVHVGTLSSPAGPSKISSNSSIVYQSKIPVYPSVESGSTSPAATLSSKLLQHHLTHSPIEPDDDGVPFAAPSTSALHFSSFASLFPSTDRSYEASLFRLGQALFDDIDLRLGSSITVDVKNRIAGVARKAALSSWLENAVAGSVEADSRSNPAATSARIAFTLLTGNQVEKACEAAMDGGNMKLATLISQAGGDFDFREDLREQLEIWREQKIDIHIDDDIRKIYALLAGVVDEVVEASRGTGLEKCKPVDVVQGLDWKRVFGLHLWFSEPIDASIQQVFESYRQLMQSSSPERLVAQPVPWYAEKPPSSPSRWKASSQPDAQDALYSLIRLYSDPACSLSQILKPLSFSQSPVDYSLPWHLYIIMSRSMRVRDFSDRGDADVTRDDEEDNGEGTEVEGHSPSADLLASTYAYQLEQLGMIQEAVFVLLHIEGSAGRRKAIKDLLIRSADKLDEWMTRGIVGSLKIPMKWVQEAQAIYAINTGELYNAYELYLAAGMYNAAHDLAIVELAPDAIIRSDLELLQSLFERFVGHQVDGWYVRGKTFLDYVNVMTRLPVLLEAEDASAVSDAVRAQEQDDLIRSIPKLVGLLPDVLTSRTDMRHKVALHEMTSRLVSLADKVRPEALSQVQPQLLDEATKLQHIRATAMARFFSNIRIE